MTRENRATPNGCPTQSKRKKHIQIKETPSSTRTKPCGNDETIPHTVHELGSTQLVNTQHVPATKTPFQKTPTRPNSLSTKERRPKRLQKDFGPNKTPTARQNNLETKQNKNTHNPYVFRNTQACTDEWRERRDRT